MVDVADLVCDECGAPATHLARDAHEVPSSSEWVEFVAGPLKIGCDKHPVNSETVRSGNLSLAAMIDEARRTDPRSRKKP